MEDTRKWRELIPFVNENSKHSDGHCVPLEEVINEIGDWKYESWDLNKWEAILLSNIEFKYVWKIADVDGHSWL